MRVKAGVVGVGAIGRNHARIYAELENVDLVAIHDANLEHARAVADQFGTEAVATLEELVERVDVASVATPTVTHREVATLLLSARKHVLVEKPIADSVDDAKAMIDLAAAQGCVLQVGHIERFNPAIRSLKQRLLTGEIGTPFQIATSRQGPFPARIRDVGVVKDLGTHDLDLTTWVAAQKFDTVAARCVYRAGRVHEDLVAVVGSLADGTATNHLVNWLSPMKERRVVVTGERGCLIADTLTADLTFYSNANMASEWEGLSQFRGVSEGDVIRYAIAKPEPLEGELTAFRDAVLGRDGEIVTGQDGLHALQVAEAILRSAQQNTVETIL